MRLLRPALVLVLSFLVLAPAAAQEAKKPCSGAEHRHFDFWLGEWDVKNTLTGSTGAVNRITSAYGGCVLREEYTTPTGYAGTSLNFYDAIAGRWRQTWIDNQGQSLDLSGGLVDGGMVLSSDPATPPVQRITWTPNEDGSVRQLWESSKDGKTWKSVFDGIYTRRKTSR